MIIRIFILVIVLSSCASGKLRFGPKMERNQKEQTYERTAPELKEEDLLRTRDSNITTDESSIQHPNKEPWIEKQLEIIDLPITDKTLIAYRHLRYEQPKSARKNQADKTRTAGNIFLIVSAAMVAISLIFLLFYFVMLNHNSDSPLGCFITLSSAALFGGLSIIFGVTAVIFFFIGLAILSKAYRDATKVEAPTTDN